MKVIRPLTKVLMSKRALVYFITLGIYKLHSVKASNTSYLSSLKPKLLIFHLDRVIWKFSIDDVDKAVRINTTTNLVTDNSGQILEIHSQVMNLLKSLFDQRLKLGAISLCPNIELVDRLMYLLHLDKVMMFQEFFYGSKINHIEKIKRLCDIPYNEIVYFDYTDHGFSAIEERGILTMQVDEQNGLTESDIDKGFKKYRVMLD